MSEGDSRTIDQQIGGNSASKYRAKKDPAWQYCTAEDGGGSKKIICDFCHLTIRGGGIHRMKEHLAGITGNVVSCSKVPSEVRSRMKSSLKGHQDKKNEMIMSASNDNQCDSEFQDDDIQEVQYNKGKGVDLNKRKRMSNLKDHMKPGGGIDASQPTLKACIQSKARWHETDMSLALWFYDACIPLNAVNSPFYQRAINMVATIGQGYIGPNYHALRIPLIKEAKLSVQATVDYMHSKWVESGCTIMGDGWTDNRNRALINFLVYSQHGVSLIKSVDISSIEANAENLCNLFSEIVEIVGPQHVVHMITDNAPNYKNVGTLLSEKYPSVSWSPCAAHCINLIMKDMTKLPLVHDVITLASRITVFVYNHMWPLNWLRTRPGWTEIIRPGDTRFGTSFIALKSLYDHKDHLQALVVSPGFKKFFRVTKAKEAKQVILDEKFWDNCLIISKIMGPIMRLLRICDSDEKPSLGYVYEGMWRVVKGVKELVKNNERLYEKFVDIIESRWDRMLKKNLHAAAFWLNPAFQYDPESPTDTSEVIAGLVNVFETLLPGVDGMMEEMSIFREKKLGFGRKISLNTSKSSRPDEWWRVFGFDAPNLRKLAIKLLSQTSSSSGCERNWSVFERIHTKKRNRLEHQRLNDLVFIHYNLRLQNRVGSKKRQYDPVDYECIDKVEFWVIDENANEELDYEELEEMLNEEPAKGDEDDMMEINDDEIDLSRFDDGNTSSLNDGFCDISCLNLDVGNESD